MPGKVGKCIFDRTRTPNISLLYLHSVTAQHQQNSRKNRFGSLPVLDPLPPDCPPHTFQSHQVRIQDLVGGGPSNLFLRFADGVQHRRASEASIHWLGSRARLRALEALVFLSVKYAFSHFSWYLFFKIFNL